MKILVPDLQLMVIVARSVMDPDILEFIPIMDEHFSFVVEERMLNKQSVAAFILSLKSREFKLSVERGARGLKVAKEMGA